MKPRQIKTSNDTKVKYMHKFQIANMMNCADKIEVFNYDK